MNSTGATSKSRVFELIQLLCWVPRWRMHGHPNFHYQLPKCEALKAGNKFHSKLWVKFKVSGSRKGCFDRDLRNTIPLVSKLRVALLILLGIQKLINCSQNA